MPYFTYRGPLGLDNPLYRGRTSELKKLLSLCQYETQAYAIIYGGRQTGKTSLALRLMAEIESSSNIKTCHIDFQTIPGAESSHAYNFFSQKVSQELGFSAYHQINQPDKLMDYLCDVLRDHHKGRLVIVLEELGALPVVTRNDLANVLRSFFTNRQLAAYRSLSRLMIVITGGIELYDLATTQVSTLYNICEAIYLDDLSESESVELVVTGLSHIDRLAPESAPTFGKAIYSKVNGQPYLTQRLGEYIAEYLSNAINGISKNAVEFGLENLQNDDVLLRHLRGALYDYQLLDECEPLLRSDVRFSRNDESMARLELLGIARKGNNNNWVVRNSLFAEELRVWLNKSGRIVRQDGNSDYEHAVFISYAWGGEREEIVNQIDDSLRKRGIKIVRDKRELGFKGSIDEFMKRIGKGNCVIVVISDKYLRSPNCMFELVEIADGKQFHDRIFPVVLSDANIYDPLKRIEYVKYWEDKRAELANAIKTLDPANLQGIRDDMDLYDRIRDNISGLASILKDMNTLTPDIHRDSDFGHLYEGIEKRMG